MKKIKILLELWRYDTETLAGLRAGVDELDRKKGQYTKARERMDEFIKEKQDKKELKVVHLNDQTIDAKEIVADIIVCNENNVIHNCVVRGDVCG